MSEYSDKNMQEDTRQYLRSELGVHHITTLESMADGALSAASDITQEHPDRYLAKYNALKEVIEFIKSPSDDDTPQHG